MKNTGCFWFLPIAAALLISCAGTQVEPVGSDVVPPRETGPAEPAVSPPRAVWKPLREVVRYADGTVDKTIQYEYGISGQPLRTVETDGSGNILLVRNYEYRDGRLTGYQISGADGPARIIYDLDSEGRVADEISQDPQGEVMSMVSFSYSGLKPVRAAARDGAGNLLLITVYAYEGDLVTGISYSLPGGETAAVFERVIENGRLITERTVLPDGTVESKRDIEYSGSVPLGAVYSEGGSVRRSVRFDYSSDGNVIRENWFDSTGELYESVEREWVGFTANGEPAGDE